MPNDLHYFSDKPCLRGHLSARFRSTQACAECDRIRRKKHYHKLYREEPYIECLVWARKRARKKNIDFSLTRKWARDRWNGCCELTGIKFVKISAVHNPYSVSIDRIENDKGYTPENCRFILYALNGLKTNGTEADMYRIAEALLKNRGFHA